MSRDMMTVKLDRGMYDAIEAAAMDDEVSRGEVIRRAIIMYLGADTIAHYREIAPKPPRLPIGVDFVDNTAETLVEQVREEAAAAAALESCSNPACRITVPHVQHPL